jgi:cysteine sulfinate desulfinase/cysteine desulfurase-like protein
MMPYCVSYYGNPHSRTHAYGWESEEAVEKARMVGTASFLRMLTCKKVLPCSKLLV